MQYWIGHCTDGTSDKVYVITKTKVNGKWRVSGHWGKRGKSLQSKVYVLTTSEFAADDEVAKIKKQRLGKGYRERNDISKIAGVRDVIMSEQILEGASIQPVAVAAPVRSMDKDSIVICKNNEGMTEWFDSGVEYVVAAAEVGGMVHVFDKFGESRYCIATRFEISEEQ